ncbi:MAG: EAL domain-containing protein [Thermodesulfovibrionales bacterium]
MKTPLRILHLEDNPNDVELIRENIIAHGIEVEIVDAATRADFIDALEKGTYDLVLADYTLPSFDGLSALIIVREKFPDLPFIFVTGALGEEQAVETLKKGATDYVLKHNLARLVPAVNRVLKESLEKAERKRAEEAMRKSEEKYRNIFENIQDVYYETALDGTITEVSPSIEAVTGGQYIRADLIGKSMLDFYADPKMRETLLLILKEHGNVRDFEIILKNRDSSLIPCSVSAILQYDADGKPMKLIGSLRDISERKGMEEELHDNYFTQATINMILSESLKNISLEEILQKSLNMILSIPWIAFEPIGSIHLVENDPGILVMKAQNSLPEPLIKLCSRIPFGKCICGEAALTRQIEFADHVDERHEICYEGMSPHGHYAVPVLFSGRTLGVLNIYLKEGHIRNKKEEEFLRTIVDTLAGIVVRKQAENELMESSRKLSTLINNLPGVAYRCSNDPHWTMEYLSEGVLELTGYPAEEFIGNRIRSFASIIEPEDQIKISEDVGIALSEKKPYTLEYRINIASGNQKWVWERGSGVFTGDKLLALEGFITDTTERRKMESRIEYLAYYDNLTGLPNRNLFIDRLTQGTARAEYSKKLVAVLTIDIDRFKSINDTYGFDTGDAVLIEVAKRLIASVRDGDTVARLGNDDFGLLLIDIAQSDDIILVVEKIMKNASQTIYFNGKEIVLTLSVGISVYPNDGKDASSLIKNADLAFAKAKQQGRKNYQFYTEGMDVKAAEFVLMEKNLFNAMKNEEFILYYQPYWDSITKKITGMEALIRWKSPESGLISPGKFIPVLEDTRMIIEVGEWILRTATRQVKEWQNNGYPVVPVSVNLSLIQFRQKDLAEMVKRIMKEYGFYPSLLTLEITESAFMQDIDFTRSVLKSLKDIGISISIDDFGTGYSSLSYLKRFPIDNLKIDISFIREIDTDPDTASIVTAIIGMAHTLNLKTIAEGVETEEQWKILRLLRCDMVQGFYFSKPLPAEEIEKMLINKS